MKSNIIKDYNYTNLSKNEQIKKSKLLTDIRDIPLHIKFQLGQTQKTLEEVNYFEKGTFIEVDTDVHLPIDILVSDKKVAQGILHSTTEGKFLIKIV